MSLENWGQMTKAQDDDTSIDTAIANAIAEHEADPESHMGARESIENHRVNEILDHPVGSALADKWTMSEFEFSTSFENLAPFFMTGSYDNYWPGVALYTDGAGAVKKSAIVADLESNGFTFDTSKEMLMQFVFNFDDDNVSTLAIFLGRTNADEYLRGMGLKIVNDVANFYTGKTDGTNPNYLSWPTFTRGVSYVVRIHNVPSEGVVKVYINGELLGTLVWPSSWSWGMAWKAYVYDNNGTGSVVRISSLFLAVEP